MAPRPNVVLVVMDTARACETVHERYDYLSELNRLAQTGTEYTKAVASAPWTLPSHASLFTGTYPSKHGAHAGHKHLDEGIPTLAKAFQDGGYETVAVSNNTWISEEFGFARGFDTLYKTWQYVQADIDLGKIARTKQGTEMIHALATRLAEGNPVINAANAIYGQFFRKRTDDGANRTNKWIREWLANRNDDEPFFCFVNYLEPHLEYRPPKSIAERFLPNDVTYGEAMSVPQDAWGYIAGTVDLTDRQLGILRALYRAELAYLDRCLGELRRHLEAAGEFDDTVFVVTGDHGENIGDHGLMDHQYSLHETLLHVPLVVHGPRFETGQVDDLVQLTDLAPTLLDAADIDAPELRDASQGRSFHPEAEIPPREHAIAEYMAPQPSMDALRERVGTSTDNIERFDRSLRAIRTDDEKLIRGSDGTQEFYELRNDPEEATNLATERSERVDTLETMLDEWLDTFERADTSGEVSMTDATEARLEDLGYLQ
ncbi:sulfatase [Halococcus thailandensis]|uniref:Sulfatase n=1 Tax=Halococcus thailandensis JCM 13552 TaxID=1227457 RepID=M0NBM6_9EURY|nr:sulfatase [Halococcus thailandensis]EMA55377.1 sulfatase [Halococcus thailandensis JCM 13552]